MRFEREAADGAAGDGAEALREGEREGKACGTVLSVQARVFLWWDA